MCSNLVAFDKKLGKKFVMTLKKKKKKKKHINVS